MASGDLIRKVKEAAVGLTHSEREGLALELASAAAAEEVQFVRCDRETLTGWIKQTGAAGKESEDAERERLSGLALRGALDAPGERRLLVLLKRAEADRAGENEAARLRAMGCDPDVLVRMKEVHSPSDYRRIVAETKGASR